MPPFLQTGANFGCTAFVFGLYQAIKTGKMKDGMETLYRITDRGPDNDTKTTHAVHLALVREGAMNNLEWGGLQSGHSHGWADYTFSMAKSIFYPRDGVGPGCPCPFQYHAMLVEGLQKLPGGCEILWQLANFNWDRFADSFVDRARFGNISKMRHWRYSYDPNMPDLHVRVWFKETLLEAEWKPWQQDSVGNRSMDPNGFVFAQVLEGQHTDAQPRYVAPDFSSCPLEEWHTKVEHEGDTSGWGMRKVMDGVKATAKADNWSEQQQQQWHELFSFHERHSDPNMLPVPPHKLTTASGEGVCMAGMPISWQEMWSTLRRLPRAHLGTEAQKQSSGMGSVRGETSTSSVPRGLALENAVYGTSHPKAAYEKEKEEYDLKVHVRSLPRSLKQLQEKQLYFVTLPNPEGEFSVVIPRAW